jgi:glycerol-3-phosphate dehydrogenase
MKTTGADGSQVRDLLVVGGGINGVGIARDAAGRGLSTLLVERDDLASATSQWSTKLIHGGLRYLEHYEFRLVGEALAEREVLMRQAPHLIEPLSFVLPHEPHLRPAWMIRAGLFLYDRIGGRMTLPRSFAVDLRRTRWGAGLAPRLTRGFVYADARVDDARLVVATAIGAHEKGAEIRTRTRFERAAREDGAWRATLVDEHGARSEVRAKAIVNAGGPWVARVLETIASTPAKASVRHVKGSHVVVPRVHDQDHAYILQNADRRIVFVIPYQHDYSLIGTTDVVVSEYEHPRISAQEIDYLLDLVNRYLARPLSRDDVVWSYSGVRPLYDDGESDPAAITRDYVFKVDAAPGNVAPVLSVYGGKLTTYRRLAEAAMKELSPFFPSMRDPWTVDDVLPGGDIPDRDRDRYIATMMQRRPGVSRPIVADVVKRHGTRCEVVLGDAKSDADLGRRFAGTLTEREVAYMIEREWARTADDLLWRRTKCGLGMDASAREALTAFVGR